MGAVIAGVGVFWAIVGVANIALLPWTDPEQSGLIPFGLMFNMLLFVLPGLALAAMGERLRRRRRGEPSPSPADAQKRLAQLEALRAQGALTETEYAQKRAEIVKSL